MSKEARGRKEDRGGASPVPTPLRWVLSCTHTLKGLGTGQEPLANF